MMGDYCACRPSSQPSAANDSRRVATLAGVLFGLTGMGSAAVAVTIPAITESMGVGISNGSWIISSYALSLAVATALYGSAADRHGIRLSLTIGVVLMSVGAVLAAVSTSFVMLIVARAIQGAGAAAVPVLVVTLMSSRYEGTVRDTGLTRLTGVAIAVGATGPLMGGLIESFGGWRLVMCLPALGPLVVIALWGLTPTHRGVAKVDLVGAFLVMIVAAAIVTALQSANSDIGFLVVGAGMFALGVPALVARVRWRPDGFVPVALLRSPGLLRTALTASTVPASWFALLVSIPACLAARGWEPLAIGVALLPSAIPGIFGPRLSAAIIIRFGGSRAVTVAAALAGMGLLTGAAGASGPAAVLIGGMLLVNLAFGIGQPALGATVAEVVAPHLRGGALGLATLIFFVGGGIGSAFAGLGGTLGISNVLLLLTSLPMIAVVIATYVEREKS